MNIALDGMPLASQLTGVGHYTFELARSLALAAPSDTFVLVSPLPISPSTLQAIEGRSPSNLSLLILDQRLWNRRWWSIGLPIFLSRNSFDLFHGTNYEIPFWSSRPAVVTIHDLSLLLYPEAHEPRLVRRGRWRLPRMAKSASRIITPTPGIKSEVCERLKVNPDKVVVTPEAPRSAFRRREDAEVSKLRDGLGISENFILFVGTVEPRKNLHRLVEAFEQALQMTSSTPQLVIAGGEGWLMENFSAVIKQKRLEERVRFTGYLHDEDLCALYSSCKAFVYPSLYEGFGLPPLEAMACGAPVIASRIPSITATVGDTARLVDPHDVGELAKAIVEMVSDERIRHRFSQLGTERVKSFTWEKAALSTLQIYRDVLQRKKPPQMQKAGN